MCHLLDGVADHVFVKVAAPVLVGADRRDVFVQRRVESRLLLQSGSPCGEHMVLSRAAPGTFYDKNACSCLGGSERRTLANRPGTDDDDVDLLGFRRPHFCRLLLAFGGSGRGVRRASCDGRGRQRGQRSSGRSDECTARKTALTGVVFFYM